MNRRVWIAGLVVGAAGGFAALELPTVGWAILAAFAIPALLSRTKLAALAGLLVGLGGSWTILLGRIALTCHPPTCQAPGLEPWLTIAEAAVVIGLSMTGVTLIRSRRR